MSVVQSYRLMHEIYNYYGILQERRYRYQLLDSLVSRTHPLAESDFLYYAELSYHVISGQQYIINVSPGRIT